jgi:hypothetical protein
MYTRVSKKGVLRNKKNRMRTRWDAGDYSCLGIRDRKLFCFEGEGVVAFGNGLAKTRGEVHLSVCPPCICSCVCPSPLGRIKKEKKTN